MCPSPSLIQLFLSLPEFFRLVGPKISQSYLSYPKNTSIICGIFLLLLFVKCLFLFLFFTAGFLCFRLCWNSLCRPKWPKVQKSFFCLLPTQNQGVHHNIWLSTSLLLWFLLSCAAQCIGILYSFVWKYFNWITKLIFVLFRFLF